MARWVWLLAGLALVAGGLWLGGRAPSDYVLQQACDTYQAERTKRHVVLDGRAARARDPAEAARLREEIDALLRAHKRLEIGGWEVLLIPGGATRPAAADFLRAGRFTPSGAYHVSLRGAFEVWYAPRGRLARLLYRLGLSP